MKTANEADQKMISELRELAQKEKDVQGVLKNEIATVSTTLRS